MKVTCSFESEDFVGINNAILEIRSTDRDDRIEIVIWNKDRTTLENSIVVNGKELISAIDSAMPNGPAW